jgi:hypothetical protein
LGEMITEASSYSNVLCKTKSEISDI